MCDALKMSEFAKEVILGRNLSSVCRTCLKKEGVVSLFSEKVSETGYTLQERIMAFAYVEINSGDGLPDKICRACLTQINRAFDLKVQCEYADLFLRQHCLSTKEVAPDESEELKIENAVEEIVEEFIAENVVEKAPEDVMEDTVEEDIDEGLSANSPGASDEIKYFYPQINLTKNIKQSNKSSQSGKAFVPTLKKCGEVTKTSKPVQSGSATSKTRKIVITKSSKPVQVCCNISQNSGVGENSAMLESILDGSHSQIIPSNDGKNLFDMEQLNQVEVGSKNTELSSSKEVFACNLCNKTYHFRGSLVTHLLKEHEPTGEFPCNFCGRAFSQELLLSLHVKSHSADRPFCCRVCGKRFIEASSLKSHEKRHKDKRFLCIHCGKFFTYKADHFCRLANPNREKTHPCNICGKKFMRLSTLTTHKKRHRVVERFQCKTCSKPFYSRQELERHTNVHLGLRPFACTFENCEHTFYSQGELNRHKKYHLGEKKFKCDQCEQAFYESGHLTTHKRKHTGERPYVCELCPKAFTDSSKLKRHVNTHYNIPRSSSKQTSAESTVDKDTLHMDKVLNRSDLPC